MIGHLPVIRCLPTVTSSGNNHCFHGNQSYNYHTVRAGVTVYTSGHFCNERDNKTFLEIFNSCGYCQEVPEQYIDGFTAFSGSGVAFVSYILITHSQLNSNQTSTLYYHSI